MINSKSSQNSPISPEQSMANAEPRKTRRKAAASQILRVWIGFQAGVVVGGCAAFMDRDNQISRTLGASCVPDHTSAFVALQAVAIVAVIGIAVRLCLDIRAFVKLRPTED